jgi:hypothetical protein
MWEELQCPVIPLLFFGAFELYPQGWWLPTPGKVVCLCLPPMNVDAHTQDHQSREEEEMSPTHTQSPTTKHIQQKQLTRDEMSALVRKKMLYASAHCVPADMGKPLAIDEWFVSLCACVCVYSAYVYMFVCVIPVYVLDRYHLSVSELCVRGVAVSVLITAVLYVYAVILRTRWHAAAHHQTHTHEGGGDGSDVNKRLYTHSNNKANGAKGAKERVRISIKTNKSPK